MKYKNKTLLKQISQSDLGELLDNKKMQKFLLKIDILFQKHEDQKKKLNNNMKASLKMAIQRNQKIKENSENNLKKLLEGFPGIISWVDSDLNYLGGN